MRLPVALLLAVTALAAPRPASAHLRSGTVAVGFRGRVDPSPLPLSAGLYASDLALHVAVRPGHTVVVKGYVGEPLLRIDAAGVEVDAASPTAAATGLWKRRAAPGWRRVSRRRDIAWHDVRVQRGRWTVPRVVDGRAARLAGTTSRPPRPSLVPWIALVLAFALVAAWVAGARRRAPLARLTLWFGLLTAAATAVSAAGFALDSYASPGTWMLGGDVIAFAAVGVAVLVLGSPEARGAAGVGLGLLAVSAVGLVGAAFVRPVVLSVVPATPARALAALAVGAGVAAAVSGGLLVAATPFRIPGVSIPAR